VIGAAILGSVADIRGAKAGHSGRDEGYTTIF
jgi:hypothetical protein